MTLLPDLAPWRSSRDFRLMWCAGAVTVGLLAFALPRLMAYDVRTDENAVRMRTRRRAEQTAAALSCG